MNEMMIAHPILDKHIVIDEEHYFTLVIENKVTLLNMIKDIKGASIGITSSFHFFYNNIDINPKTYVSIISDLTDIDLNSKSTHDVVNKRFISFLASDENLSKIQQIENILNELSDDFRFDNEFDTEFDNSLTPTLVSKMCSFNVINDDISLLKQLYRYIDTFAQLKKLKLLVICFANEFLYPNQIKDLYIYCKQKDLFLLNIESTDHKNNDNELKLIIDDDLTIISDEEELF